MDETFEFCPYCGQHTRDKLTLVELFRNTIANYFSFDSRIKRSFVPLLFKPGYLPKAFIFGKRQKYIHPAQFYLFCAVIFFFLFALATREAGSKKLNFKDANVVESADDLNIRFNNNPLDSLNVEGLSEKDKKDLEGLTGVPIDSLQTLGTDSLFINNLRIGKKKLDSLIEIEAPMPVILDEIGAPKKGFARKTVRQFILLYMNNGEGLLRNLLDKIPITLLLLLPIFAFILKLLYLRRKQPYVNHLVFTFYFFTFVILIGALVLILQFLNKGAHPAFMVFFGLATLFYVYVAMRQFYNQGRFKTILKLTLLFLIYNVIALPFAVGLMALISFLTYGGA